METKEQDNTSKLVGRGMAIILNSGRWSVGFNQEDDEGGLMEKERGVMFFFQLRLSVFIMKQEKKGDIELVNTFNYQFCAPHHCLPLVRV